MLAIRLPTSSQPAILVAVSVAGAGIIAGSALVRVPMWPVPMTLQTLAIVLIAGAMGLRAGLSSVALYVAASAVGWPVLAGGAVVGGPTTGYLIGFFAEAAIMGAAVDRGWCNSAPRLLTAIVAATTVVFLPGVAWLAAFWLPSLPAAVAAGLTPFLIGDTVKVALGFACLAGLRRGASPCR